MRYAGPEQMELKDYNPKDVFDFLIQELRRVGNAMAPGLESDFLTLKKHQVAPTRVVEDMIVYADGTNWNPGAGIGVYQYRGGAWVKLG